VTIDVLPDGRRRPGGTALYSALQAARLGLEATIVTRGREDEMQELLAPFSGELELIVEPAPATTTLQTTGSGEQRRQRMLAWAGPMAGPVPAGWAPEGAESGAILHLAPVAAELTERPAGEWRFAGLTPQGLLRAWNQDGDEVVQRALPAETLPLFERCGALVLSRQERGACEPGLEVARRGGALVAVTAGPGTTVLLAGHESPAVEISVSPVRGIVDDLGAGDVYAAALFVALAEGSAPERAAALAGTAAALRLAGSGPQAIGGRREIEAQAASAAPSSPLSSSGSS
jgi:sugar/nucleoside kinase (ribokinase family)